MKIIKEEEFEDWRGRWLRKTFADGHTSEVMLPGTAKQEFINKDLAHLKEEAKRRKKQEEKERKIAEKMREMAIKELEKEDKV